MKSSARSGFTLVEVIIVIVIMAVIMGSAIMSVTAGMRSAAVRDAARTVQQYVRHAKAVALLKQRPVVLQFEEVLENGEFVKSRISLTFSGDAQGGAQGIGMARGAMAADGLTRTLSGQLVDPNAGFETATAELPSTAAGEPQDPLMAEPREFQGVRISARLRDETESARPRISVFSNVDVLLKKKAAEAARAREKEREAAERGAGAAAGGNDEQKEEEEKDNSFSVVYEANGRCEPFQVTVYKDGTDERDGLVVNISRFGRTVTED